MLERLGRCVGVGLGSRFDVGVWMAGLGWQVVTVCRMCSEVMGAWAEHEGSSSAAWLRFFFVHGASLPHALHQVTAAVFNIDYGPEKVSGNEFRFRYVLHPFAAKYSHWMWH
jgi:hypothetical protein